ncbi:hypothetical protein I315_02874 [Cryptococcus gattii Ru294]|uniref:Uncharacterized protein n=2 Tax=Cryptococcus gattii TaxID=37769 RepID=E6RBQ9_CRYGW|nr:Hypothetical Protein CGB_I0460W [Cryptococcus gattii WM276]KIR54392.1 hypothetical protein I315_02874 [Cryptococcus gattii Ru294]KIR76440.1 hypothetical protein I306_06581 [Cryptococcus gattii EJB2]KIY30987.1 hypothetical protein I305_06603 [Cryptococcus gattii E566]KJE01010.1 hypothetical protein I311_05380 [Cryptococcus gattii NT-10]ADV24215.1 Hypothetical Protein CGB_I0460W [Cryptococcus gattii WM276]
MWIWVGKGRWLGQRALDVKLGRWVLGYDTVEKCASNALDRNRYRRDGDDDTPERVMLDEDMVSSKIHCRP